MWTWAGGEHSSVAASGNPPVWVFTGVKAYFTLSSDSFLVRKQDKLGVYEINLLGKFSFQRIEEGT